jgi:hypothetical protein
MVPKNTSLGELEIFEIYEYLDGPRLFAARNNIGTIYLVYWFDEREDATGWLYLPISEARLNELRRKAITLNATFKRPETNYFRVYTGIHPGEDTADPVPPNEIDTDFFPPEDYYIEYVDVVKKTDDWSFETVLNGKRPSAEALSQFIGRFRELIEDNMNKGRDPRRSPLKLYPQSASPGSIKIKFGADSNGDAIESLKIVDQLIRSNDNEEFRRQLIEQKINPSQLKDFLSSITRNKLDVEFAPKLASDGGIIKLPTENINRCLEYLDDVNFITVDTIKIPQANDLDKVLEVVSMIDDGIPLIPENIDGLTTDRQVKYYTDAAYALGLVTKDKQLTTFGHFINSHSDIENKYEILANSFESTDLGWAWMAWAQVQYMTELDPKTAADFIIASVPGLSEVTARRRASTLEKWLIKLQPYHRKYKSE